MRELDDTFNPSGLAHVITSLMSSRPDRINFDTTRDPETQGIYTQFALET